MEDDGGKDGHQQETQFVYRRDFRRITRLQGAKVADPRSTRGEPGQHQKSQVFGPSANGLLHFPATDTNPVRVIIITNVRTSVAKSESMLSGPIFAKIAVSAANTADRRAQ
jgi:hypothetical protein